LPLDALSLAQNFFFVLAQILPTMEVLQDSLLLLRGKLIERLPQDLKPAGTG
jgi:hypothetical protein